VSAYTKVACVLRSRSQKFTSVGVFCPPFTLGYLLYIFIFIHHNGSKKTYNSTEQDAQLSQRDRAAGCVIVFAKSRTLELEDNDLRTL